MIISVHFLLNPFNQKIISIVFVGIENKKIGFWNLLTFKNTGFFYSRHYADLLRCMKISANSHFKIKKSIVRISCLYK